MLHYRSITCSADFLFLPICISVKAFSHCPSLVWIRAHGCFEWKDFIENCVNDPFSFIKIEPFIK